MQHVLYLFYFLYKDGDIYDIFHFS